MTHISTERKMSIRIFLNNEKLTVEISLQPATVYQKAALCIIRILPLNVPMQQLTLTCALTKLDLLQYAARKPRETEILQNQYVFPYCHNNKTPKLMNLLEN